MKRLSIFLSLICSTLYYCQNIYIDVTTTLAMKYSADQLKAGQEKTVEQQTKLQQAQSWVSAQMVLANEIQNKVLKGLQEVSGTLTNGIQVVNIYRNINDSYQYAGELLAIVQNKPQFSVFGVKASEKTYQTGLELVAEVSQLLQPGQLNLATSGDRYKLLFAVDQKVRMLKLWIYSIKYNVERAIRLGFWKSINPFQGYIQTDKSIVQNIMDKYKHNF